MFLVYYNAKDGTKGWRIAEKEEIIEQFIKENEIEDYGVTISETEYVRLNNYAKGLEEKIDTITTSIEKIIKGEKK